MLIWILIAALLGFGIGWYARGKRNSTNEDLVEQRREAIRRLNKSTNKPHHE